MNKVRRLRRIRRSAVTMTAILGMTLTLSACGGDDDTETSDSDATSSGAYPVSVASEHGEITVKEKPERIVVIGADFVDLLDAIDEQPVVFSGYGQPDEEELIANYPWLDGLYTGEFEPALVTAEYKVDPEAVAIHEPDLIIGTPYYIEEKQYRQLSEVAPTYVVPAADGRDWTDTLADLAALTDKRDEAEQAVAEVDAAYTEAREGLSAFEGKSISFADQFDGGLRLMSTGSWVEDLGLVPAPNQPAVGKPFVSLSLENLPELSGDLAFLVAYTDDQRAAVEEDPRFGDLPAAVNESVFFVGRPFIDAGLGAGPTSLVWLLETIQPLLESSALASATP